MKIYSENLLMRYNPVELQNEVLPLHFLMALPKKKLGAVGRNRLRRICKSALFQAMKNMTDVLNRELNNSYNIVIHARENFNDLLENERVHEFETLLKRLIKKASS